MRGDLAIVALLAGAGLAATGSGDLPPSRPSAGQADLVELVTLDPTLRLDIRYATSDNFLGRPVYRTARAFLQRPAALALVRANRALEAHGYGILVLDAYRPWSITKLFWDLTPPALRGFVANPKHGSRHNRGGAVDVTLYLRTSGREVEMTTSFDDFSERAAADWPGGTAKQRAARDLLRKTMEAQGFTVLANEWWHFDHRSWRNWPVLDVSFDEAAGR